MTITKKQIAILSSLVLVLNFYGQTPSYDLPEHTNETFLVEEPEVCLSQSEVAPQNLRENELEDGIMLKWDPVPVTFGCQIKGGIVGEEETTKYREGYELQRIYYAFSTLEPNREYRWKVRCACKTDPLNWGSFSEYKNFTTPNFDLPYDPDQADVIVLFPNPTSGDLNLHYNKAVGENSFITIYSVNGNMIRNTVLKSGLNFIDTTELEKGFYLLLIETMEESKRIPFVKS